MKLNLIEQFLLIALDDDEGRFVTDTTYLYNGFAGAILMELAIIDKIELQKKKVAVTGKPDTEEPVLDQSIKAIQNLKEGKTVGFWIGTFNANAKDIKEIVLQELIDKGILRREKGKIFWVIPYVKYPTDNPVPENKVRAQIQDIIMDQTEPEPRDLMLLSLIDVCELTREAFRSKEVFRKAGKRIVALTQPNALSNVLDPDIQKIHVAVMAATRSAVTASTTPMV